MKKDRLACLRDNLQERTNEGNESVLDAVGALPSSPLLDWGPVPPLPWVLAAPLSCAYPENSVLPWEQMH